MRDDVYTVFKQGTGKRNATAHKEQPQELQNADGNKKTSNIRLMPRKGINGATHVEDTNHQVRNNDVSLREEAHEQQHEQRNGERSTGGSGKEVRHLGGKRGIDVTKVSRVDM